MEFGAVPQNIRLNILGSEKIRLNIWCQQRISGMDPLSPVLKVREYPLGGSRSTQSYKKTNVIM